jgi:diaminopropionate ammonia-lyase
MAGLACGDPNPLAWPILRDCTDAFIRCPDYVAAKGMRVYGLPLKGDPFIVSGESGAVTLGTLMFLMQWDDAESFRNMLGLNDRSDVLLIIQKGTPIQTIFGMSCGMGENQCQPSIKTTGHRKTCGKG